jgi:hypothetical protein
VHDLLALFAAQRARPAPQRNLVRATWGGFAFVLIIAGYVHFRPGYPYNLMLLAAGAVSLLYLVVGAVNSRGVPFDFMSLVWTVAGIGFCGWLCWSYLT